MIIILNGQMAQCALILLSDSCGFNSLSLGVIYVLFIYIICKFIEKKNSYIGRPSPLTQALSYLGTDERVCTLRIFNYLYTIIYNIFNMFIIFT